MIRSHRNWILELSTVMQEVYKLASVLDCRIYTTEMAAICTKAQSLRNSTNHNCRTAKAVICRKATNWKIHNSEIATEPYTMKN